MCRLLQIIRCFLLVTFLLACSTETPRPALETTLYVFRFDPPAFVELSADLQERREIPLSVPPQCRLFNLYPPPVGNILAIELSCPTGQTVLFMETGTGAVAQPIMDSDSHYLAWTSDGGAAYLKVDSLGSPRVVRVSTDGTQDVLPITGFTYDLASSANEGEFTFTFSRGLGQGSELWLARRHGNIVKQLYTDPLHYISFARYSPDGRQIAFVKIPDTQTPFTVGELWVMNSDGSQARSLAEADAGHGYAAGWSPDGRRIAFVGRENPDDARADQSSEALRSNVYVVDVSTGALTPITHFEQGRVETPLWSPNGNTLAFNVVINDRMNVHLADLSTGELRTLMMESSCCPAWMRK
jgi:hypothetical protein